MWRLVGALIVTVVVGIASRVIPIGFVLWDEYLGNALYAVAVYLVVAIGCTLLRRHWSVQVVAGIAVGLCWALEAFQATGWTARTIASASIRTVLGTTFGFTDLIGYVVGVAVIAVIDVVWLRPDVALPKPGTGSRTDW